MSQPALTPLSRRYGPCGRNVALLTLGLFLIVASRPCYGAAPSETGRRKQGRGGYAHVALQHEVAATPAGHPSRVTALEDPALIRQALTACVRIITGKAAATTQRRKRAIFRHRAAPGPARCHPGAAA